MARIMPLLKVVPLRISTKAGYLAISLFFAMCSLVSGQIILFSELRSLTLSHCRRLNMQNIFFYNQSISSGYTQPIPTKHPHEFDFTAPEYCLTFLTLDQSDPTNPISNDDISDLSDDLKLRLYADRYADAEKRYADRQMNMLIILLTSNVLSLIFQAIHLYQDSKDIN